VVKGLVISLATVALAGCGTHSGTASACTGLSTAQQSKRVLVLFGAVTRLTTRAVCSEFGRPLSVQHLHGGREVWRYGSQTLILRGDRVVAVRASRVPIGG
jgi:hypothetical protein